ncbi:hypothetical protein D3C87_1941200 [compost metagenome]
MIDDGRYRHGLRRQERQIKTRPSPFPEIGSEVRVPLDLPGIPDAFQCIKIPLRSFENMVLKRQLGTETLMQHCGRLRLLVLEQNFA